MLEEGGMDYGTTQPKKFKFNIAADTRRTRRNIMTQGATDAMSSTWHQGSNEVYRRTFELLEQRYERSQGQPLTMQDYLAFVLLIGNIVQGAITSNTWSDPVLKVIVGGSLAILAKLNDSVGNAEKQKKLKKLQDNFIKAIEEVPYGVKNVLVKKCPSGYGTIVSRDELIAAKGDPDNSLFAVWQEASSIQFFMDDPEETKFTMHNLSNTADHYTKFAYLSVLISWLVLFTNIGFDLSKIVIPTSAMAFGKGSDPNNQFTTHIFADLTNPLQVPLYGNYSVTCSGYTEGNYTTDLSVVSTVHNDPAVSMADWIMTACAGVPWMSLASVFITWMIKNEYNIREQAIRHANVFANTYKPVVDKSLIPGYIPEELDRIEPNIPDCLLKILKTNKQNPNLYRETSVLQYQITFHNQKMDMIRAWREGSNQQEFDSSSRGSGENVLCLTPHHFTLHASQQDENAQEDVEAAGVQNLRVGL